MRWPLFARKPETSPGRSTTDELIIKSEGVRLELLATTSKLAAYTQSLQDEIMRLKTLADRVKDDG